MSKDFSTFGRRLRYARKKRARISQEDVARHMKALGFPVTGKLVGYWETIGEPTHSRGRRVFYPDEIIALIELYQINGLWLYGYERTPGISIEPSTTGDSIIFGRPVPITGTDLELNKRIAQLSECQKKSFLSIISSLND